VGSASTVFCWPLSELFSLDYIIRVGGGGGVSRGRSGFEAKALVRKGKGRFVNCRRLIALDP
jgi:hypothetical protein